MDPVVDFDLDSYSDDEDKKGGVSNTRDTIDKCVQDNPKDFEFHTLIPNRDIEIHAVQTPTPRQDNTEVTSYTIEKIPSSSLATMESLDYFRVEGSCLTRESYFLFNLMY